MKKYTCEDITPRELLVMIKEHKTDMARGELSTTIFCLFQDRDIDIPLKQV